MGLPRTPIDGFIISGASAFVFVNPFRVAKHTVCQSISLHGFLLSRYHALAIVWLLDKGSLWLILHKPNDDQYPDLRHYPPLCISRRYSANSFHVAGKRLTETAPNGGSMILPSRCDAASAIWINISTLSRVLSASRTNYPYRTHG